ncbi:MAG: sulfite exporter TauE/SafE family protein [Jatrophihabitans sp.]
MTWWQMLLVLAAGIGAGTINTVVGSGTLITFPVLLAVGLPSITANVSNTMGLAAGNLSGVLGYRKELEGQRSRATTLGAASLIGGVAGAILLLTLPAAAFDDIVPVLIGIGVLLVIVGPWVSKWLAARGRTAGTAVTPLLWVLVLFTGVYGGYFGAAQGVILMAVMGLLLNESMQRLNGMKNLLAFLVNTVAALVFLFTAHINWTAAGLIAAGSVLGGLLGARVGRRLSPTALRAAIVVVGIVAIVKLLV